MNDTSYLRALRRFWWLGPVGLIAGAITMLVSIYSISLSIPPKLAHRSHPTYTASALLLVNSTTSPYLRTGVTNVVPRPPKTQAVRSRRASGASKTSGSNLQSIPQAPSVSLHAPDTHTLVQAANLFPLLIQSDQIAAERHKLFGLLAGTVSAKALYSFVTPSRFKPSSFPVIEVDATARGPKAAKKLAQQTTIAFQRWLTANQNESTVPDNERILVEEIQSPAKTTVSGGTKKSLPLTLGGVVFLAFLGLAIFLDRARPKEAAAAQQVDQSPAVAA